MSEKMKSVLNIALAVAGMTAVSGFLITNKTTGVWWLSDVTATNDWNRQVDWHNQSRWIQMGHSNEVWFAIKGMPPLNTNLENLVIASFYEPIVTKTNPGWFWEIRFRKVDK